MKVTFLMPTYNDAETIIDTLDSIKSQTYENWELLIMDDGSRDNTEELISEYVERYNIKYFKQENADQLNAIKNLVPYITGDIIFIIHSDDLLSNQNVLENFIRIIDKYPSYETYFGNLRIINENSHFTGQSIIPKSIYPNEKVLVRTLLWLGRNSYLDYSFFKREFFINEVYNRYLVNNTPYWFSENYENISKSKYVNLDMCDYRIHKGNYIESDVGNASVLSGNMRVFLKLMRIYSIPSFALQFILFRVFENLPVDIEYLPLYRKKETKNKSKLYKFAIKKRLGKDWKMNYYYKSIYNFLRSKNPRYVDYRSQMIPVKVYKGSDSKLFFKNLFNNSLDDFYIKFMSDLNQGVKGIKILDSQYSQMEAILEFYGLTNYIALIVL